MFPQASLRNYRKSIDKDKGSILRFIRRSDVNKTKTDACLSNSTETHVKEPIKDDSSLSSDNSLDVKGHSKILFIESSESNDKEDSFKVDPKDEGININAVLNNTCSSDEDSNESDKFIYKRKNTQKRQRIDSDDDTDQETEKEPPSKKAVTNSNGSINGMSDYMIERLVETYCDLYPTLSKMEVYDVMLKWDGNLAEVTKNLDTLQKEQKSVKQKPSPKKINQSAATVSSPLKKKREEKVSSYRSNKENRNKIWKLKGQAFHEEIDADEGDEYVGKSKVYVSDSSDDECEDRSDGDKLQESNFARDSVLKFFNEATLTEIISVPGCSKKKADIILQCRPFENWQDLVYKFKSERFITAEMLNSAKDLLYMRDIVRKLMKNCESISSKIESLASEFANESQCTIRKQPSILSSEVALKPYQLIGLNWLDLMHRQDLNGVLADEMGLGKTVQAIAFLAHLKELDELDRLCLVIVPSSTLDNWAKEFEKWCPSLNVLLYHGSQDERRGMRADIVRSEDFVENTDIILTTYNMVTSSVEDRVLFRKISFHTVVFDEAHMLKNMASQRYENLMRIKALRRVLLTGTPLQNNLVELMSLLIFVMPQIFHGKQEELKKVFSMFPRTDSPENKGQYEKERINEAKRIMKPFFLRRLKDDVLKELPPKEQKTCYVQMSERQEKVYCDTVNFLNQRAQEIKKLEEVQLKDLDELVELQECRQSPSKKSSVAYSSANMLMTLRKIANHPLLVRNLFTDETINDIASILKETTHKESNYDYIVEDLAWMSDFEIHKTCLMYNSITHFKLSADTLQDSGKFKQFDQLLPIMKKNGDKVLIFSQFVIMLDILEEYLNIHNYNFLRLDGRTHVADRQDRIDKFNDDSDIFVFLLSTRAGGLGINLSSANKVILHDIDFNPYNDKQAEDRCHRVGQTREVTIHKFMSKDSIEEGIHNCALRKLDLEREVTNRGNSLDSEQNENLDVLTLLKTALGLIK